MWPYGLPTCTNVPNPILDSEANASLIDLNSNVYIRKAAMIKLVLSDMDGTLLPIGASRVSDRAQNAIAALQSEGIAFGLATGRDVIQLKSFFDGDDTAFRTGILANGMKVFVDGQLAYLTLLDNEMLQRISDLLQTIPGAFLNVYPRDMANPDAFLSVATTREETEAFSFVMRMPGNLIDRVPDVPIISATIAYLGDHDELEVIKRRVKELVPIFDYISPFEHWVDILPAGINKGAMLPQLLEAMGITADEVLFFGDADNDLPIMNVLENTVAMANSMPSAEAAARWHIGASEDDGVAQALEELVRATRAGETPAFMR